MNEVKRIPMVPGYAPQTMKLIEKLKTGKPGDKLTDAELTAVAGVAVGVREKGYACLGSAIRFCIRNHGVVWERVRKCGMVQCLNASEIVNCVDGKRRHIRKAAGRATKTLVIASTRHDELPESEKPRVQALAAQLGAITAFSDAATTKRLVARPVPQPDMKKLMSVFE